MYGPEVYLSKNLIFHIFLCTLKRVKEISRGKNKYILGQVIESMEMTCSNSSVKHQDSYFGDLRSI